MSYFEDFIEPQLYDWDGYDQNCWEESFQYTEDKWFTDGKWEFYEHLNTKHLQSIRGFLEKNGLIVPKRVHDLIDERVKEMFDEL